ncbi:toprim domain-containing protein (plasmid) [Skermanella sp. TT6]|uniref:Toprim domain-containing protein n=1 Tax=Skermanella cutis TaxID=2775420 RepID=A0ABX7BHI7_9PROT|nr:toprim domain-containing protein [Skermanella sp. TT6]QQP93835.1 toprim domain-containing protein [Skermanella sp. TT6]
MGYPNRSIRAEGDPARVTDEQRRRIADRALEIAAEYHGKPTSITSTHARFGAKGSLKVNFASKHAGTWVDWEAGTKGDMIALIQHQTGMGFIDALEHALKERVQFPVIAQRKAKPTQHEADPSIFASQQWAAARSITGTLAETYLVKFRGIPADVVDTLERTGRIRFHSGHKAKPDSYTTAPALLISATDLTGKVHGFQAVRLKADGDKRDGVAKLSAGSLSLNHAIGWLSDGDGDVICGEGPEDGITLYAARPDAMVGVAFGGLKRLVDSVPAERRIVIAAQNDSPDSRAAKSLAETCKVLAAAGCNVWIARPPADVKDANDLLRTQGLDAVRAMLDGAVPVLPPSSPTPDKSTNTDTSPKPVPHWPATTVDATTAYAELQILLEDWMTQAERWLEACDYTRDQCDAFITDGMSARDKRDARRTIDRAVARTYPGIDLKRPPRLQLAAAAGLGKSSGVREAYLRHPKLWNRQFHGFFPTVALARGFESAMKDLTRDVWPAPLVVLHRGRDHEAEIGNAPCVRHRTARKLAGKVPSVFSALCMRGDTMCPHFKGCEYINNYLNQGAGLHLFVHDHLTLGKPLGFPAADLAVIDEDSTRTLLTSATVGAALLAEPATYQSAALTNEQDDAAALGARLLVAITSGAPMLAAIRDAKLNRKQLDTLARWAEPTDIGPDISPAMSDKAIEEVTEKLKLHQGKIVGRIVRQLARELRHPRDIAHGVSYRDGDLHLHRHSAPKAVPKGIPLLIIDADADLATNRILFGSNLAGREIMARRLGRVTQIRNATLAKSYIAPEAVFSTPTDRQVEHTQALRARILAWISRKAKGGKVLVVTNKPVRTAFTGEGSGKIPVSVEFGGATWTHYGAILGIDAWKHYDAVVLLGREEMSASAAEQQARAIHCDDPIPLNLTGRYRRVTRCHRMRHGPAVPVGVYEHDDHRVQVCTEAKRERGMAQALDRLRLIHGRADREVFILSNLPLPGIEVDTLLTLNELLDGGTAVERLIAHARNEWGVLPLSAAFLAEQVPHIATSRRTAERLVAEIKTATRQIGTFRCRVAEKAHMRKNVRFQRLRPLDGRSGSGDHTGVV